VLITKSGISKIYFTELPKEVWERFHYDSPTGSYRAQAPAAQQTEAINRQAAELAV